jgi:AGCS family alanine or glycine:cation symporter
VIDFSDSMIFAMALANIVGLYIMASEVRQDLDSYWSRLKRGELVRYRHQH